MNQRPATTRLTARRRCVLYMRAAGWSYEQVAERLGITTNMVRKDLIAINKTLIPGLTDGDEPAKGYRLIYALGLLDAGADPADIPHYMEALLARSDWLQGVEGARTVPVSNLADVHTDGQG